MKSCLTALGALCLLGLLFVGGCVALMAVVGTAPEVIDSVQEQMQPIATKAEYDAIRDGMSYAEVAEIIGTAGEETASGGAEAGFDTKMYSWQNPDGSNMNAMFQNDRMIQKAQFGLK